MPVNHKSLLHLWAALEITLKTGSLSDIWTTVETTRQLRVKSILTLTLTSNVEKCQKYNWCSITNACVLSLKFVSGLCLNYRGRELAPFHFGPTLIFWKWRVQGTADSRISTPIDYCNAILHELSNRNIRSLQCTQNAAARAVCNAPYRSSAMYFFKSLYWLPAKERIDFKIAVKTQAIRLTDQPSYLAGLHHRLLPTLRLKWTYLLIKSKKTARKNISSRAFSVAAPTVWNDLPFFRRSCNTANVVQRTLDSLL